MKNSRMPLVTDDGSIWKALFQKVHFISLFLFQGEWDDDEYDDAAAEDDDDGTGDYEESEEGILINRNAELYPQPVLAMVNFDHHLMDMHDCHRSNNNN